MEMKFADESCLKCKHCGFVKPRLDLYCYFKWNGGRWSDMREQAPQQAIPAIVQYCPACKRFYYIEAEGVRMTDVNDYVWIEPVEYRVILPSIREYDKFDWDPIIEYNQRLLLMWAYNDTFYRDPEGPEPTDLDKKVARWNLSRLMGFTNNPIELTEYLREAEYYDECLRLVEKAESALGAELSEEDKDILARIAELARQHDCKPFKISD